MKNQDTLSIIIPVYNAELFLPIFFKRYSEQNLMNNNIELILIDNGSTDGTKKIILNYIKDNKHLNIKYSYFDKVADSYASRNYGIKNSRGAILAFTDSDCMPEPNWIENIYSEIEQGIVISGEVEIQIANKQNIWEVFDSMAHLNNEANVNKGKIATANLAVMRSDFMKVGLFEERYSGGDHDWSQRAKINGLKLIYVEHVKVLHPSRKEYVDILQKSKRMAYGQGVHYNIQKKSMLLLVSIFFLKIFNIRTNIRYSKLLYKRGFKLTSILKFNCLFMKMRIAQLDSSIKGYRNISARSLKIK